MTDSEWTTDRRPDVTGRTIVVAGATAASACPPRGNSLGAAPHVVLAVRDETKGRRAVAEISLRARPRLELRRLDLADLDSVTAFTAGMQDSALQVDVLINNAGVMGPPHTRNRDGQELQFLPIPVPCVGRPHHTGVVDQNVHL